MFIGDRRVTKPGCSVEEIRLIRGFFAKTQLVDYYRLSNPGSTAYTYFRTPGDSEKGNGLRLDYVYGTMAPWGKVNVLIREDVPGVDHLPVYAYTDG
jgi:exonuclease III